MKIDHNLPPTSITASFNENNSELIFSITDVDSDTIESARIRISSGFETNANQLLFSN